ncbi:MFS transporter [Streptomyces sp. NPDC046881]|uniref:MFS transporter n=1 Tax=Streptomyces sp. NPDC046881 TaxID=3155374 RepID=UPI0033D90368
MTTQESVEQPAAGTVPASPWRNRDFRSLMVGSTASNFGYQISEVAVPLAAIATVGASAFDVGMMRMVGQLPYPLLVLFVGVLVDRWRRRNMLIAADLGRALALALIPLTYAFHGLGLPALYIVAFLVGTCTVLFDVGSQAYLPRLVEREQIARGNSELETARSAALICGPALGGLLVSLFMPPVAVIAAVGFFLLSAVGVWRIRKPEPVPDAARTSIQPFRQIGEGIRFVARNPVLRSVTIITACFNFCYAAYTAIYLVYLPKGLHLSGYEIGLAFAATGPGLLVGALFSSALPKRFGYGRVLITCAFISNVFLVGVSLVHGNGLLAVGSLVVLNFLYGCLSQTFSVSLVAIRQAITPDRFLGRVMATLRFLGVGLVPLGSLFGGFLGSQMGLRPALFGVAAVMLLVPVPHFVLRTALTRIGTELPDVQDEDADPEPAPDAPSAKPS